MKDNSEHDKMMKSVSILLKHLPELIELIAELNSIKNRTPYEEKELEELIGTVSKIKQQIEDVQLILGDKLYRKSVTYYYHVKGLAENGNEEAKKIYEDLKPLYEAGLMDQIIDN